MRTLNAKLFACCHGTWRARKSKAKLLAGPASNQKPEFPAWGSKAAVSTDPRGSGLCARGFSTEASPFHGDSQQCCLARVSVPGQEGPGLRLEGAGLPCGPAAVSQQEGLSWQRRAVSSDLLASGGDNPVGISVLGFQPLVL